MGKQLGLTVSFLTLIASAFAALPSARVPPAVSNAVSDDHRPAEQRSLDNSRKPAELLAFAGIRAGNKVADFMPGNAYFTRILSRLVGPSGRVYAFTPLEQIQNCDPAETAGWRAVQSDAAYRNVTALSAPVGGFAAPEPLDAIWMSQNFHDLHDKFMGPADIGLVNRALFKALKPGGLLLVIDHTAADGSGLRDTETLHRIDPASVRAEIERAGFVFDSQSDVLHNPGDDHSKSVFDSSVRGKTDQFVYRFRKPNA